MRELKFRCWHKYHKKIYNVYELDFDNNLAGCQSMDHGSTHTFGFIDVELMQFTGAKDFFESEIYEGDIVFLDSRMMNGEIVNDGISWRIKFKDELNWLCYWHDDLHVIGNIYQNKELLNE